MLLTHLLLNTGSVECSFLDFFCVNSEIMFTIIPFFQKLIKGGVGTRAGGGRKSFQKLISGGDDYSVLESNFIQDAQNFHLLCEKPLPQTYVRFSLKN